MSAVKAGAVRPILVSPEPSIELGREGPQQTFAGWVNISFLASQ